MVRFDDVVNGRGVMSSAIERASKVWFKSGYFLSYGMKVR